MITLSIPKFNFKPVHSDGYKKWPGPASKKKKNRTGPPSDRSTMLSVGLPVCYRRPNGDRPATGRKKKRPEKRLPEQETGDEFLWRVFREIRSDARTIFCSDGVVQQALSSFQLTYRNHISFQNVSRDEVYNSLIELYDIVSFKKIRRLVHKELLWSVRDTSNSFFFKKKNVCNLLNK